jgi:nitroreductase
MNLDECIQTRKSIRKFTDQKVSDEHIFEIIKAGIRAPSGGNFQPWYFIIIQNEEFIENMRKTILEKYTEYYEKDSINPNSLYRVKNYALLFNAKTVISVCVDLSKTYLNSSCSNEIDRLLDSIEVISVGACIENMLLKIHDLGLGACWCRVGHFSRQPLEKLLDINSPYFLVANIALGYPAEIKEPTPRKDINSVCRIIH